MNEEVFVMDKKNFSTLTPASKCQQELPKSSSRQDGASGGQLARRPPSRRRDSALGGASNASTVRTEIPVKKPPPQKSKALEKKPRPPRSDSHSRQVTSEENSESEASYLPRNGGKKQNLNHLLQFHFAPRERSTNWRSFNTHPGTGWVARGRSTHGNSSRPKFNKENFLQANCQFLVKSTGDYTVHDVDPDILVDWNMVEQIKIRSTGETPFCPICLSPPVGAKMTKCGHIFCWPCILHYLALSDHDFRTCPICFELVGLNDLRSVVATMITEVDVGQTISLQLMVRSMYNIKAMPLLCKNGINSDWENCFSKLLPITPAEVLEKVVEREHNELQKKLKEDEKCPEVCFLHEAMTQLITRKRTLLELIYAESKSMKPDLSSAVELLGVAQVEHVPERTKIKSVDNADPQNLFDDYGCTYNELSTSNAAHSYFYQAADGQNIFLHPLNMTMLWQSLGPNPLTWPQIIEVRVIEKESVTLNAEQRKRFRFLRHLPLTTSVQLVEAELDTSLVTEKVRKEFNPQLIQRQHRRFERIRVEKKREEYLEAEERRKHAPLPRPKIESKLDFPTCGTEEEFEGLQHALLASIAETSKEKGVEESDDNLASCGTETSIGVGTGRPGLELQWGHDYPILPHANYIPDAPHMSSISFAQAASSKFVSRLPGTARSTGGQNMPQPNNSTSTEPEAYQDEYSVPTFRTSIADGIAKALATHQGGESSSAAGKPLGFSNKKGKKKGKGKVLFTTGFDMGSN